jgi:hypothetical protein
LNCSYLYQYAQHQNSEDHGVTMCREDRKFSSCIYMRESDQSHANHANPSWHTRHLQPYGILTMVYHSCIHLFFGFCPHPVFRLKHSISARGSVTVLRQTVREKTQSGPTGEAILKQQSVSEVEAMTEIRELCSFRVITSSNGHSMWLQELLCHKQSATSSQTILRTRL